MKLWADACEAENIVPSEGVIGMGIGGIVGQMP